MVLKLEPVKVGFCKSNYGGTFVIAFLEAEHEFHIVDMRFDTIWVLEKYMEGS